MKETISVFVIDDNEYYNNVLSNSIQQSVNSLLFKGNHQLVLYSFTDAKEYIRRIKSNELDCKDTIVFVDYYLGEDIYATQIIELLKEHSTNTTVILMSQSKAVKDLVNQIPYDYFVIKDNLAPALCSLYLKQYIENKFSVTFE
jgi:hypothetical protein